MATLTAAQITSPKAIRSGGFALAGRFALFAIAPLAAFGGVNLAAETLHVMPLFFSPMGLPGWAGAALHLVMIFLIGMSMALVADKGRRGVVALRWGAAFVAVMIVFPFAAGGLDSLSLALMMSGVLLIGLATSIRIARLSSLGGWLMLPVLGWVGFGAALGLAVAAAWSPPFALINAQQPAAPAAN